MIETIGLFFLTWYGIGSLFLLSFFLVNAASFLSFILVCATGYLLYLKAGNELSIALVAVTLVGYFLVGALWSFFRYKRYINERIQEHRERGWKVDRSFINSMKPSNCAYDIFIWISVWPASMAENLIDDATKYVQKLFSGVYRRIFESATKDIVLDNPFDPHSK